jgi:hypothetical protein
VVNLENGEVIIENIRFGAILRDRERILLYDTACRMSRVLSEVSSHVGALKLLSSSKFSRPGLEQALAL